MTQVRTHKVTRGGTTYTRRQHTRAGGGTRAPVSPGFGAKLRPARAWWNAKQSVWMARHRRKAMAALYGTAAITEFLAFTVFRGLGAVLIVAGACLAVAGYGMKDRMT